MHVPETRHFRSTTLISSFLTSVKIFPVNTPKYEPPSIYFDDSQILWQLPSKNVQRTKYQSSRIILKKWKNVSKISPRYYFLSKGWKNKRNRSSWNHERSEILFLCQWLKTIWFKRSKWGCRLFTPQIKYRNWGIGLNPPLPLKTHSYSTSHPLTNQNNECEKSLNLWDILKDKYSFLYADILRKFEIHSFLKLYCRYE